MHLPLKICLNDFLFFLVYLEFYQTHPGTILIAVLINKKAGTKLNEQSIHFHNLYVCTNSNCILAFFTKLPEGLNLRKFLSALDRSTKSPDLFLVNSRNCV